MRNQVQPVYDRSLRQGARQLMRDEGSYLPKWKAVAFMNLQKIKTVYKRAMIKFV